jgi:hypothetical protein
MAVLTREEIATISAYEQEMVGIRRQMAELYWGCRRTMERYTEFVAELAEGGKYATLGEQYASDSAAVTPEDVTVLFGAMGTIIATLEIIEVRAPGMWGIPIPEIVEETSVPE